MKKRSEVKKSAAARTEPMFVGGVEITKCGGCGEKVRIDDVKSKNTAGEPECPDCGAPVKFTGEKAVSEIKKVADAKEAEREREKAIVAAKMSTAKSGKFCPKCGSEWPIVKGSLYPNCGHDGEPVDDPAKAERHNPAAGHQRNETKGSPPDEAPHSAAREVLREMRKNSPVVVDDTEESRVASIEVTWPVSTFPIDRNADLRVGGFKASVEMGTDLDYDRAAALVLKQLRHLAELAFKEQLEWYLRSSDMLRKTLDEKE